MDADGTAAFFDRIVEEWSDWAKLLDVPATSLPSFERMSETPPVIGGATGSDATVPALIVTSRNHSTFDVSTLLQSSLGYQICLAGDFDEALSIAVAVLPKIVIIDADFSGAGAQDFCRKVRGADWGRPVYLVALSDQLDKENFVAALESGVDTCLFKSLGEDTLVFVIDIISTR
jgi:DNA-binding response OmpR family regulator